MINKEKELRKFIEFCLITAGLLLILAIVLAFVNNYG
ncbi:hypothetical protein LCGC14_2413210 [marine sediment metagenome]|uniref:Uncharacterized protein n=1 Tax=marine sediment metagenome TaxID=412755 RepID=A0A0F9BRW9_9ZZZZ